LTQVIYPDPTVPFLKEFFKKREPLVGAEIGVAEGNNALNILKELPIKKLYLIDPYTSYIADGQLIERYIDSFRIAYQRLSKYKQVQFIKKTSDEAVEDVNEPLDFVYIDGNHSYEWVKKDIENYYPKVKIGGVIGGHDYTFSFKGVIRAVDEFVQQHRITKFFVISPDWWIIKEKGQK